MTAYEFYWRDPDGEEHFIGILPERRKKEERITPESISNWGRMVISSTVDPEKMFYIKVKVKG